MSSIWEVEEPVGLRRSGIRRFGAGEGAGMAFEKLEVQLIESVSSRGELGCMERKRKKGEP